MQSPNGPLRVGIGGPVGSGKTALMDALCKAMRSTYDIAAITNDIYTKWDAEFLVRAGSLDAERITGVETGGCPHTAIREDASMNLAAVADMRRKFPQLDLVLIESGGDILAGIGRFDDLCHRCCGRRQDSLQRWPRDHALGSPCYQQNRSRALCRSVADKDAERREAHARGKALCHDQSASGRRLGGDRTLH